MSDRNHHVSQDGGLGDRHDPGSAAPLSVEALRVSYRSGTTRQSAIDDVSFTIRAGEAYGLIGESGSGKSTVAMAIARYLARDARIEAGRITLAGADVNTIGARALRELRRTQLGLVYQDPTRALNPTLTVGRQLIEAFELAGTRGAPAHAAALDMLDRCRMPSPARALASYPHQMSGGMQQRAVIAMALAKSPALLILDEATTGLDATVEADIIALVDALRRESGAALLFISHKLPLVAGLCDRVGILQRGRLVEEGEPARLFAAPSHPYTAALLACIPTLGHTHRDGPLATLDDVAAHQDTNAGNARSAALSESPRQGSPKTSVPSSMSSSVASSVADSLIFEARDLTKSYRVGNDTVCALDHVSIALRTGETLGLVGESGSGKTTLARIVAGLVQPDSGQLMLDGSALPARVEARTRTQTSALQSVFQNPHSALNRAHRVRTLLGRAVGKLAGLRGAAREQRVRALLDAVRLPQTRLSARARELSGGQQQRIAIARAFAGQPRIVICDEPTSALDVSVQAAVLNLLVDLQRTQHASYLFISHDLAVVRYVADHIAVLYRGQMVESGPADAIFAHPRHPYTEALLRVASGAAAIRRSATVTDASHASATPHPGATGCVYAASCASSLGAQCERERPADIRIGDAHTVRCHLYRTSDTGA